MELGKLICKLCHFSVSDDDTIDDTTDNQERRALVAAAIAEHSKKDPSTFAIVATMSTNGVFLIMCETRVTCDFTLEKAV